jgi:hypothetical protein
MSNIRQSWYEAGARERIAVLVDRRSFAEFVGPECRETSPHLGIFDLPAQFDDGIVVGSGSIDGTPVLVAAVRSARSTARSSPACCARPRHWHATWLSRSTPAACGCRRPTPARSRSRRSCALSSRRGWTAFASSG